MELYLNDVYPYAQQISNYIEREIFQQKLKAGQKLLSITNLSKELNIPYIITTDSHYLKKSDRK